MELLVICKVRAAILLLVYIILMVPLCSLGRDAPGTGVSGDCMTKWNQPIGRYRDGKSIWQDPKQGGYGLPDSFNIDENWISDSTIGIAHRPMPLMIENARTSLI